MELKVLNFSTKLAATTSRIRSQLIIPFRTKDDYAFNLEYLGESLDNYNELSRRLPIFKYFAFLTSPLREKIDFPNISSLKEFNQTREKGIEWLALTKLTMDLCSRPKVYTTSNPSDLMTADEFLEMWSKLKFQTEVCILSSKNPLELEENDGIMWSRFYLMQA